ncbi:MAG: hypothetical protein ACI93R_001504 [Flavobacteriales bacterium]|jgi:hypothetical protein
MSNEWLANKRWKKTEIVSSSKMTSYMMLGFAVFWNAMSFSVVGFGFEELVAEVETNPGALVALIFPVIGVFMFVFAIIGLRRWWRFGTAAVTLDPFPGGIGGQVGGRLKVKLNYSQEHAFAVSLSCLHSTVSGSGKNRKRHEKTIWQADGFCQSEIAAQGTALSFCFDVPEGLPEAEAKRGESYYLWRLQLTAKLKGPDFNRRYDIPVYKNSASSSIRHLSTEHHRTQEQAVAGIGSIMRIRQSAGLTHVDFPAARRWGRSIGSMCFGLIFLGSGIGSSQLGAPIIFAVIFSGVGLFITVFGLYSLAKSLHVQLSATEIRALRNIFGIPILRSHVTLAELKSLDICDAGSSTVGTKQTVYYCVKAQANSGKSFIVAERLCSRNEAELLCDTYKGYLGLR